MTRKPSYTDHTIGELEILGLSEECSAEAAAAAAAAAANETVAEEGSVRSRGREGRFLFNPIVFLTRLTTSMLSTTVVTTTAANTAQITFAVCTPSDVASIIGPTC